ncbi:hypothetical protein F4560_007427 [Saccharothrix ecbatanensis]|uniref:Uncharacterized protein n=1 Tax=Saccharothrix ecbatanensis TaxID=1105145 RepID=A0A7W9M560_9PSEU|nr:hypothetical protein [Saccharothrix ecbatanensis]MBB5807659.1 hypothetical protein [Saccharothrix ecbatanensis]
MGGVVPVEVVVQGGGGLLDGVEPVVVEQFFFTWPKKFSALELVAVIDEAAFVTAAKNGGFDGAA